MSNILDCIGHTPIVKLHRVTSALACECYAKCEFMSPGGSAKDRIALEMVEDAEKSGRIKPGDTLIEPTSGNTGIGLAMVGAVKGYRVIITMSDKMSHEKQVVMEALGATVHRVKSGVAWNHPDSHIMLAKRLQQEIPHSHILDQYTNPSNIKAHCERTGREIYEAFGGDLQQVVIGVGTGGTITGVAQYLKARNPAIKIVGVDPLGSILSGGESKPYLVEGIGYDFYPEVFDPTLLDELIVISDQEAFLMARRLIREEGLLIGGSSGAAMCGLLQAAAALKPHEKSLVILPDSIRNYLTKFVDDTWMEANGFSLHA